MCSSGGQAGVRSVKERCAACLAARRIAQALWAHQQYIEQRRSRPYDNKEKEEEKGSERGGGWKRRMKWGSDRGRAWGVQEGSGVAGESGGGCPDITPSLGRFASKRPTGFLSPSQGHGGASDETLRLGQRHGSSVCVGATGSPSSASLQTLPSTRAFGIAT